MRERYEDYGLCRCCLLKDTCNSKNCNNILIALYRHNYLNEMKKEKKVEDKNKEK
jgi:hypothetical protein